MFLPQARGLEIWEPDVPELFRDLILQPLMDRFAQQRLNLAAIDLHLLNLFLDLDQLLLWVRLHYFSVKLKWSFVYSDSLSYFMLHG